MAHIMHLNENRCQFHGIRLEKKWRKILKLVSIERLIIYTFV